MLKQIVNSTYHSPDSSGQVSSIWGASTSQHINDSELLLNHFKKKLQLPIAVTKECGEYSGIHWFSRELVSRSWWCPHV